MKSFTIIFLLIFTSNIFCQAEDQNFYLSDDKLSWQKAYPTEKSKEEVYAYFEESEIFKKAKIEGNVVLGKLNRYFVDTKKVGPTGIPPIVVKTDFSADVQVEYRAKEKDYVISLSNLVFVGKGDFLKKNEEQRFEKQFVREGYNKYRPGFLKRPKEVYNITISPIFEIH